MTDDATWMARALELAERGRGAVEPNPLVGAVVVNEGQVVGSGWHERFGGPHAEVHALREAGDRARGGVLYVTLEPCCHHGKTPPCVDAVVAAGLSRVVAAMEDPFPRVAGEGIVRLRQAGIAVDVGVATDRALRQNAPYLTLLGRGRPYVHGKWAMSLDGKIATHAGDSRWISNAASRRVAHQLRGRMDGILVGIGTALADDPELTSRPPGPRTATRVVLDSAGRLPLTSKLAATARQTPTLVAVSAGVEADRLRNVGCEVIELPVSASRRLDIPALLLELGRRRWTNLLVEGGGETLASFLAVDALDELHVFVAPKTIGGRDAPSPAAGAGIDRIADANLWNDVETRLLDGDVYIRCRR